MCLEYFRFCSALVAKATCSKAIPQARQRAGLNGKYSRKSIPTITLRDKHV